MSRLIIVDAAVGLDKKSNGIAPWIISHISLNFGWPDGKTDTLPCNSIAKHRFIKGICEKKPDLSSFAPFQCRLSMKAQQNAQLS
jgi:hypothetical protein